MEPKVSLLTLGVGDLELTELMEGGRRGRAHLRCLHCQALAEDLVQQPPRE